MRYPLTDDLTYDLTHEKTYQTKHRRRVTAKGTLNTPWLG
jgi:hypothetical protein